MSSSFLGGRLLNCRHHEVRSRREEDGSGLVRAAWGSPLRARGVWGWGCEPVGMAGDGDGDGRDSSTSQARARGSWAWARALLRAGARRVGDAPAVASEGSWRAAQGRETDGRTTGSAATGSEDGDGGRGERAGDKVRRQWAVRGAWTGSRWQFPKRHGTWTGADDARALATTPCGCAANGAHSA